jgi:Ser/Thr protein kinase RdoA (MazF antagonist)
MHWQPPESIIARDPALMGLGLILNPETFKQRVVEAVPALADATFTLTYIRYKKGTNCIATYQIEQNGQTTYAYAKAYPPHDREKFYKATRRPTTAGEWGVERLLFTDVHVTVAFFPNDDKVAGLVKGMTLKHQSRWARWLGMNTEHPTFTLLRYKPERRAVFRVESQNQRFLLRFYRPGGFDHARTVARLMATSPQSVRLPRLQKANEKQYALAFEWLDGIPLHTILTDETLPISMFMTIGATLARFHAIPIPPEMPPARIAVEADPMDIADLAPALAERVERVNQTIKQRLSGYAPTSTLIHGDFYADQILIEGDEISFIDLDRTGMGDPIYDIALFCAHLEREVIRGSMTTPRAAAIQRTFLAGYSGSVNQHILDMYVAAALLRFMSEAFRQCRPAWESEMEALLERAEALLDAGSEDTTSPLYPVRTQDVIRNTQYAIPDTPILPFALQPELVNQEAWEDIHLPHPHLTSARLVRHKAGRRALIAYEGTVQGKSGETTPIRLMGKLRVKGVDTRSMAVQAALYQKGFVDDSADEVSVPQVWGSMPSFHLWFQERVEGVPFGEVLAGADGIQWAERAATALAKLHDTEIPTHRTHRRADELRILHSHLAPVIESHPEWGERIETFLAEAEAYSARVAEMEYVGIHRDFYQDQLVVAGERLYLVDFDLYCCGEAAVDVGNFIAHLQEWGLREYGSIDHFAPHIEAFRNRYLALRGDHHRPAIDLYTHLTLLRHIAISQRIPARRWLTSVLLEIVNHHMLFPLS